MCSAKGSETTPSLLSLSLTKPVILSKTTVVLFEVVACTVFVKVPVNGSPQGVE
jgi:hypothetical protein